MIKLILNPGPKAKSLRFDKETITIGNDRGGQADVAISDTSIQNIHIKIVKEDDQFLVMNVTNDPFASLNGFPFGKKVLKNNDLLEIGNTVIRIELVEKQENHALKELDLFTHDELESVDIDALVREVEELEGGVDHQKEGENRQNTSDTPQPSEKTRRDHEKELEEKSKIYDLNDSDNEHEHWHQEDDEKKIQTENRIYAIHWIKLLTVLVIALILGTGISSVLYFHTSDQYSQEEKKIAAGISDIAMAITHARLNHITPNNENWTDPDFILNNLSIVLSPDLHTQAQINNEGRFSKYPYILRVYTSRDMSRFLVIAQPSPNLLQWLPNRATIVIDSTTMELRKISDLKDLNRLLANSDPLEGKTGAGITRAVKEGALMQLTSLAGEKNHWGFAPPKTLEFIRPGAQYYIYNAPRYYPLGESLLKKALLLNQNPENIDEIPALQAEIKEISQFPDIVLYTSQDLQRVIDAQKVLTTFSPDNNFLIAYVKLNPKGYIASSHLLMSEEREIITPQLEQMIALLNGDELKSSKNISLEPNHLLYLHLRALATERTRELTSIATKIVNRINQENHTMTSNFGETIDELLNEYKEKENEISDKIKKEVIRLHKEYAEVPFEKFMEFLESTQLSFFVGNILDKQHEWTAVSQLTEEEIEKQFKKISHAQTIEQLDNIVQETAEILSLSSLPDPGGLIMYQEVMHDIVLQKLGHFLLLPTSIYAKQRPEEKDEVALKRILKTSWVTDPDEKEFFLTEFDYLRDRNDP